MTRTTNDVLAVASQSGPTVTFFDAVDFRRLEVIEVPSEPHELCFDPVRRRLYATITYRSGYYHANTGRAHELVVIDPDRRRILDVVDLAPERAPHGIALDPSGGLLWVSVEAHGDEEGALVALDADSLEPVRRLPVGAPGPHWFTLTPDGSRAYSANKEAPFLSVLDIGSGTPAGRIAVPGSEGIAASRDGRYVYAAAPKGDLTVTGPVPGAGVRVIDTATGAVVRTHRTDGPVFPVHVTATHLVLAGELRMRAGGAALGEQAPGLLHVYGKDGEDLGSVEVGAFPLTITSSPDGRYGYVAAVSSSTVTVVDLPRRQTVATLHVERAGEPGAHGLAYIPSPAV
ncbi:YncE family protein [Streptomyces sp. NBC_00539]|uniref:YncE family protein n=1 Tax=Streptomyces sp. NBC_00539 TaxID=2975770 RepID=UPI002E809BDF|nr:YncE family protein [Streptomyces sp. NBC_00539]WUC63301.1 YncE family protein [Streptomyces sp. NBC_00539]